MPKDFLMSGNENENEENHMKILIISKRIFLKSLMILNGLFLTK